MTSGRCRGGRNASRLSETRRCCGTKVAALRNSPSGTARAWADFVLRTSPSDFGAGSVGHLAYS